MGDAAPGAALRRAACPPGGADIKLSSPVQCVGRGAGETSGARACLPGVPAPVAEGSRGRGAPWCPQRGKEACQGRGMRQLIAEGQHLVGALICPTAQLGAAALGGPGHWGQPPIKAWLMLQPLHPPSPTSSVCCFCSTRALVVLGPRLAGEGAALVAGIVTRCSACAFCPHLCLCSAPEMQPPLGWKVAAAEGGEGTFPPKIRSNPCHSGAWFGRLGNPRHSVPGS